jgi:hypothetical protein
MSRSTDEIIDDLNRFDGFRGAWSVLNDLVNELKTSPAPAKGTDALLGVFERHPGATSGGGVFWPILHTLESLPGFETHLIDSVRRVPAIFTVMMVNRLLNSGVTWVRTDSLLRLLEDALGNPRTLRIVKEEIESVLQRHRSRLDKRR